MRNIKLLIYLGVCISWLTTACEKSDMPLSPVKILGHGGMGIYNTYPINTLEALFLAEASGAHGVEIDVQLSKDYIPVVFHDELLDGSTSLSGRVHEKTWMQLQHAFYTSLPYQRYKLVSLEQVFKALKNSSGFLFSLDCKAFHQGDPNYYPRLVQQLGNLIEKYALQERVLIESGDTAFLAQLKAYPGLQLYFVNDNFEKGFSILKEKGFTGLAIDLHAIRPDEIMLLREEGLKVQLLNAQSRRDNKEALEKLPDFIQTDRVKAMLNLILD